MGSEAREETPPLSQESSLERATDFAGEGALPEMCLENTLGELELGSSELPTVGSVGHRWETCKPCAFFHTRGCEKGVQCAFCHLCDAGTKKRRRKAKFALV